MFVHQAENALIGFDPLRRHHSKRWRGELQATRDKSKLPESPEEKTQTALNDLLVSVLMAKRQPLPAACCE